MADYRRDNRDDGDRNRGKKDQQDGKTRAENSIICVKQMVNLLREKSPEWLYRTEFGRKSFASFRAQPIYTLTVKLAFSAVDGSKEAMHALSCYWEGEESLAYAIYATAKKLGYVAPEKPADLYSTVRAFLVQNISANDHARLAAIADRTNRPATSIEELAARRSQMQDLVTACKPRATKVSGTSPNRIAPIVPSKPTDQAVDFARLVGNGNASMTPRPVVKTTLVKPSRPVHEAAVDFGAVGNHGNEVEQISDAEFLRELDVDSEEGRGENFNNPYWQEDGLVVLFGTVTTDAGYTAAEVAKAARFIFHLKSRRMKYAQAIEWMERIGLVLHTQGEPTDTDPEEEHTVSDSGGTVEEIGF